MKILCTLLLFVITALASENANKLNLVKVDLLDESYKKLMTTEEGFLSAPPLAVLNVTKLFTHECFQNLRSKKWSLAVPIMFWNQTYMDMITKSVNAITFFKQFSVDISSKILPPSGIMAYRLNWRRKAEIFDNNNIVIDNSWYTTKFEYVLPKFQNFIIEFDAGNVTKTTCKNTKKKLLIEPFQSQELSVSFMTRKIKPQNISKIHVTLNDIRTTKLFNKTGCQDKIKCFVSLKYAEKWSYEVSTNVMSQLNIVHLGLQKDIYDAILNYLCKDKVPISDIESQTITKLVKDSTNEMGCSVERKVYSTLRYLCEQGIYTASSTYYRYDYNACVREKYNYLGEIIASMTSVEILDDRNVFHVPVKLW